MVSFIIVVYKIISFKVIITESLNRKEALTLVYHSLYIAGGRRKEQNAQTDAYVQHIV